ncbi:MAG: SIMPL domain-containing protein [Edaphobacter sp.]|uniref:SIMPL domain-containing protein n=1 Tax=Edaphobacter sp. TaxID=1934404 RepID=UPI002383E509|nr:SIMPL domain-containing protein [Edaphobacter sp.]MDE1176639.1 SIMPL domain-containing protein [Edaphobacter sp.]
MTGFRSSMMTVALALTSIAGAAQTIQVNKDNRTIAITATDKVTAIADQATLNIGFIAYGRDSNTAYANGSRVSNAIVKALTAAGVPKETIQSQNQQVSPVQPYQLEKLTEAQKAERQFQVTQSWTVKTEANEAAKLLDVAVKAGANQSGQIEWGFKDDNAPDAEAAAKAIKRARGQAELMASSLGAKLGSLLYASNEAQPSGPRPMMRSMAMASVPMDKVEPLAINPREIERSATVYAVFAIE